ncbi:uncharacterized protein LOC134248014 [Saccostrea cucullata]|uniref:uncharacterized protein LOC134248014 n=1 Tax=Saccostrea cuccullata TaxID=36930 RepID=UPI002ED2D441
MFMKNHLVKNLEQTETFIVEEEIFWVLTVPALWDDPAKHFLRTAAEMAALDVSKFAIVLEPEAASIWCLRLPVENLHGSERKINTFQEGSKYLILDAGGEATKITVHEVKAEGKLKVLERASGGDFGGISVDKAFKKMLCDILGGERALEGYIHRHTVDYLELLFEFKIKKLKRTDTKDRKITLKIPISFMETFSDIQSLTSRSVYKQVIKWEPDKLRIDSQTFESFFKPACNGIIEHVNELLRLPNVRGIQFILMVGGFSESPVLQDVMKKAFPTLEIIAPQDAGLVVLKGAVLFGQNPSVIESRIDQWSTTFDPSKHDKSRKFEKEKPLRHEDLFSKYIKAGEIHLMNVPQEEQINAPMSANKKAIDVPLHESKTVNRTYIDDPSCLEFPIREKIGCINHDFEATLENRPDEVKALLGRFKESYSFIKIKRLYFGIDKKKIQNVIAVVIDCDLISVDDNFEGYPVDCRRWKDRPYESTHALYCRQAVTNPLRDEQIISNIELAIEKHSRRLMCEHSNLEIISASPVQSKKMGDEIIVKECIVLYCSHKGVIPFGEDVFPSTLDGITVDIREGLTKTGTLGGFVDIGNEEIGFITCAHVLHSSLPLNNHQMKEKFSVVQPGFGIALENNKCGVHIQSVCPTQTQPDIATVDVALVKISRERQPERGLFAGLSVEDIESKGFSKDHPLEYRSGEIRDLRRQLSGEHRFKTCVKVGSSSGLTKGVLHLKSTSVRLESHTLTEQSLNFVIHKQLEICAQADHFFATNGDSGALVFQVEPGSSPTDDKLVCIGMIIGVNSYGYCLVTPINDVLEHLPIPNKNKLYTFREETMDQ